MIRGKDLKLCSPEHPDLEQSKSAVLNSLASRDEHISQCQNGGHLTATSTLSTPISTITSGLVSCFYYQHMNFKADTIADGFDSPQPSYTDEGEAGHVKWSRDSVS